MGHTDVVSCLARGGSTKLEEYFISSSDNGYVSDEIVFQGSI